MYTSTPEMKILRATRRELKKEIRQVEKLRSLIPRTSDEDIRYLNVLFDRLLSLKDKESNVSLELKRIEFDVFERETWEEIQSMKNKKEPT